jgi:hypothetical protein
VSISWGSKTPGWTYMSFGIRSPVIQKKPWPAPWGSAHMERNSFSSTVITLLGSQMSTEGVASDAITGKRHSRTTRDVMVLRHVRFILHVPIRILPSLKNSCTTCQSFASDLTSVFQTQSCISLSCGSPAAPQMPVLEGGPANKKNSFTDCAPSLHLVKSDGIPRFQISPIFHHNKSISHYAHSAIFVNSRSSCQSLFCRFFLQVLFFVLIGGLTPLDRQTGQPIDRAGVEPTINSIGVNPRMACVQLLRKPFFLRALARD